MAPAQDRAALRVLYNATGGADWTDIAGLVVENPVFEVCLSDSHE